MEETEAVLEGVGIDVRDFYDAADGHLVDQQFEYRLILMRLPLPGSGLEVLREHIGIVEEIERLASYLSPPAPLCCPNTACANYAGRVPAGAAGAYASFGKTAIGNPRWRCNVCGKTLLLRGNSTPQDVHRQEEMPLLPSSV